MEVCWHINFRYVDISFGGVLTSFLCGIPTYLLFVRTWYFTVSLLIVFWIHFWEKRWQGLMVDFYSWKVCRHIYFEVCQLLFFWGILTSFLFGMPTTSLFVRTWFLVVSLLKDLLDNFFVETLSWIAIRVIGVKKMKLC